MAVFFPVGILAIVLVECTMCKTYFFTFVHVANWLVLRILHYSVYKKLILMSPFRDEPFIMDQEAELHLLQERCKCLKAESVTGA